MRHGCPQYLVGSSHENNKSYGGPTIPSLCPDRGGAGAEPARCRAAGRVSPGLVHRPPICRQPRLRLYPRRDQRQRDLGAAGDATAPAGLRLSAFADTGAIGPGAAAAGGQRRCPRDPDAGSAGPAAPQRGRACPGTAPRRDPPAGSAVAGTGADGLYQSTRARRAGADGRSRQGARCRDRPDRRGAQAALCAVAGPRADSVQESRAPARARAATGTAPGSEASAGAYPFARSGADNCGRAPRGTGNGADRGGRADTRHPRGPAPCSRQPAEHQQFPRAQGLSQRLVGWPAEPGPVRTHAGTQPGAAQSAGAQGLCPGLGR